MGQFFRHLPQPLHFSGSMVGWGFSLLQMGQWWSTTWARYSSRKYFSVLWTGLQALWPRPHRAVLRDGVRQVLQQVQILQSALVVCDDPVQDLQHPLGALPAGDALAAGLLLGELHEEPGHLHHAGVLVHDHQAAGADHGADALQTVEVQGQVQVLAAGGGGAAGGAADLDGLELLAVPDAAADVKDHLPDGGSHGDLDEAGIHHVACQGEGLGAGAGLGADGAVPLHALADDEGARWQRSPRC